MSKPKCTICSRLLNIETDALSADCGGDCWGCVGEIEADRGWEPSLKKVLDEWKRGLRPNWTPPPPEAGAAPTGNKPPASDGG